MTSRLSRFYMMASSNLDDMEQHMQQSDLSTNVQTLHDLTIHFIRKVPRDDDPDPHYEEGMEIIKQECKNMFDILEQDPATWDFKDLMKIYIPRTTGVADEDKPYLDWMEALIHDLLTARLMWQPVYKQSQTSGQIFATTTRDCTIHRRTERSVTSLTSQSYQTLGKYE